jgi:hypothetical protein
VQVLGSRSLFGEDPLGPISKDACGFDFPVALQRFVTR